MSEDVAKISITVDDKEVSLSKKYEIFTPTISISRDDPELDRMAKEVIKDFKGDKNKMNVTVKIKYQL
jgi:hypothetical protein